MSLSFIVLIHHHLSQSSPLCCYVLPPVQCCPVLLICCCRRVVLVEVHVVSRPSVPVLLLLCEEHFSIGHFLGSQHSSGTDNDI